jgi:hypothetical protein
MNVQLALRYDIYFKGHYAPGHSTPILRNKYGGRVNLGFEGRGKVEPPCIIWKYVHVIVSGHSAHGG